jgi:hypothetical protein
MTVYHYYISDVIPENVYKLLLSPSNKKNDHRFYIGGSKQSKAINYSDVKIACGIKTCSNVFVSVTTDYDNYPVKSMVLLDDFKFLTI